MIKEYFSKFYEFNYSINIPRFFWSNKNALNFLLHKKISFNICQYSNTNKAQNGSLNTVLCATPHQYLQDA